MEDVRSGAGIDKSESGGTAGAVLGILGLLVLVVGAVIVGASFLERLSKSKKKTYRCPNCNSEIEEYAASCQNCGRDIQWTEIAA